MHVTTPMINCILRPWSIDDKADLVRAANNRKVWRNLTDMFPHPYTETDADNWFHIAGLPGRSLHFAIELEGKAVGGISAIAGDGITCATAQFGYWLGEQYWGRGLATTVARALVAHIESEKLFARLEAPVFEWNPASMRVLEKIGFKREGVLRNSATKDGQLIDSVMYAYITCT